MKDVPPQSSLGTVDMIHHMLCAYVGPVSDFEKSSSDDVCPKCRRILKSGAGDWEIMTVTVAEGR